MNWLSLSLWWLTLNLCRSLSLSLWFLYFASHVVYFSFCDFLKNFRVDDDNFELIVVEFSVHCINYLSSYLAISLCLALFTNYSSVSSSICSSILSLSLMNSSAFLSVAWIHYANLAFVCSSQKLLNRFCKDSWAV